MLEVKLSLTDMEKTRIWKSLKKFICKKKQIQNKNKKQDRQLFPVLLMIT